ncbi:MAG TPA: glycosyltransferase, partial [candidate division WOR-3 bacterium]|nr:glycosyltransferase [candidate division WOR-3 bacterium]
DVLRDVGGFDPGLVYAQDYDLWFKVLAEHDMSILPEKLVYYRWHGGNLTYRATEATEKERAEVLMRGLQRVPLGRIFPILYEDRRPEVVARCKSKLLQKILENPPSNLEDLWRLLEEKFREFLAVYRPDHPRPLAASSPAPTPSDERMSIMLEVESLDKGGLERVVYNLAHRLTRQGHNVVVCCVERGGATAEKLLSEGIPVEVLPRQGKDKAYREVLQRYRVEVVNAHYSFFGGRLAWQRGIPFVQTVHNLYVWLDDSLSSPLRETDAFTFHYIAVSTDVKRYLVDRFKVSPHKVTVIFNGIDPDRMPLPSPQGRKRAREELGIAEDEKVLLCIGAYVRHKMHHVLLDAVGDLGQEQVRLIVAGSVVDPIYFSYLEGKSRALSGRVMLFKHREDVYKLYWAADVFVLPSLFEGFSMAMLEALYYGLPLVMTDIAGFKDVKAVSDVGIGVPPPYGEIVHLDPLKVQELSVSELEGFQRALSQAIRQILYDLPEWRRRVQTARDSFLATFDIASCFSKYETLMQKIRANSTFLSALQREREELLSELKASETAFEKLVRHLSDEVRYLEESLRREIAVKEELQRANKTIREERDHLRSQLETIYGSKGWKALMAYRKVREKVHNLVAKLAGRWRNLWIVNRIKRTRVGGAVYRKLKMARPAVSERDRRALQGILARHPECPIFVFAPIVNWDIPLFQRPHHLALQLAKRGILFFFCEPKRGEAFVAISERLYLCRCFELLLELPKPATFIFCSTDNFHDYSLMKNLIGAGHRVVYDYIDEIDEDISQIEIPSWVYDRHYQILRDEKFYVIATADRLYDEVRRNRQRRCALITNGVDYDHFRKAKGRRDWPERIRRIKEQGVIIGYYGALAKWFDFDLLKALARDREDFQFVLIGPDYDGSITRQDLTALPNVHWLGPVPYAELPLYASAFDVATIPFKINKITVATSPIKLFEYMALGLPIVTTPLPECQKYEGVLVAENKNGFLEKIDHALTLRNDKAYLSLLDRQAKENSWGRKAEQLLQFLQQ